MCLYLRDRSRWSSYNLQLFVTVPIAETLFWRAWALPDWFFAKSASGWSSGLGILWGWFWGGSLSAGDPLGAIKNIRHPIVLNMWTNGPDVLLALFGVHDWYGLTFTPRPTWLITKKMTPNGDFPMFSVKGSIELSPWRWVKMKLDQSFILCLFFSEYIYTVRQHQDCKTMGPSCHLCFNFLWLHISPSRSRAPCSFTRSDAAHCPAFVPKKIDERSVVLKICQTRIAQRKTASFFGLFFLWNDFRMVTFQSQAAMVTIPVLGLIDKSTVPACCWLLFFLFHLKNQFSLFLPSRDKCFPVVFTVLRSIFLKMFSPLM